MPRRVLASVALLGWTCAASALARPPLVLWAWERPEDLRFADPAEIGVAYLAGTTRLEGSGMRSRPRLQPLHLPDGIEVTAVVRVETRRAALTDEQAQALADPALSEFHPSAQRHLARCRFRSVPEVRLGELVGVLAQPGSPTLREDLSDLTDLIDAAQRTHPAAPTWTVDATRASSDLLDWTMSWEEPRGAHALERWRTLHSLPWLVAALELSTPSPDDRDALLADARAVDRASPACFIGAIRTARGPARRPIGSDAVPPRRGVPFRARSC